MRLGSLVIASFAAARVAAAQIPTMVVSPPSVTYTVPTGSVWSSDVPVSITSDGASISGLTRTIAYGASQPTGWLKATLSGSGTPAILSFQVDAALLVPGTYDATVTVKSKLTGVAPQAIAVKLTVTAAPPAIAVARTATLTAIAGSLIPVDLKLDVTNGGGGKLSGLQSTVTYPNGEITGWLTAALGSPDAPTMLNLRAPPIQSLLGGVPHASVVITAKGTSNSPQTVDVSFNVTGLNPAMQLTPSTVSFFGIIGTGDPAPQSVTITNVGGGTIEGLQRSTTYAPGEPSGWLKASLGGRTGSTLVLSAFIGTLTPGVYTATVQVTSTTAYNSPQSVTVNFAVGNSPAHLTLTPTAHDFGSVGVGGASAAQAFTITNDGGLPSGPFTSSSGTFGIVFGGANPGDFLADPTSSCAGASSGLAPHASCDIVFRFSPTAVGARSAGLSLSASPGGTVTAALSGTGTTDQVIIVTPLSHDFGDVGLGTSSPAQRFVLTNPLPWPTGPLQPLSGGLGPAGVMAGPNPGDFSFDPNSSCAQALSTGLAAGGSCYFDVSFVPQGLGPRSATLVFQMTPGGVVQIPFSGNGVTTQFISITPVSHDFGSVDVGLTTAPQRFTLTNSGPVATGPFVTGGLAGPNPGDFAGGQNGCQQAFATGLAAGASCDFEITFTPQVDGPRAASLTLSTTPGGIITLQLSGSGVFRLAAMTIAPATYDFGTVRVGEDAGKTFTVTNQSAGSMGIESQGLQSSTQNFYFDPDGSCFGFPTLAPGASCTVNVDFRPEASGSFSATLGVATTSHETASATLTGTGTPPVIAIAPVSHDFGTVTPGVTGTPQTFQVITNVSAAIRSAGLQITGPGATAYVPMEFDNCAENLLHSGQGVACTFYVSFAPQDAGPQAATVTAQITVDDGTTYAASSDLTGSGAAPIVLSVAPSAHDYGSVFLGQASPNMRFTVANPSTTKLILNPVTLTGPNPADFAVDPGNLSCANLLLPGASCTFDVAFRPTDVGTRSATVTISSGPNTRSASVDLTGTGTPAAAIVVTPASHDFGSVYLGQSSAPVDFTITNTGIVSVGTLLSLSYTGPGAADYTFSPGTCVAAIAIAPGASCTFRLSFTPQATGPRPATLTVTARDLSSTVASTTVNLAGTGTAPTLIALTIAPNTFRFGGVRSEEH